MSKKKSLKKILSYVFVTMLVGNAGIDFGGYVRRASVERKVAEAAAKQVDEAGEGGHGLQVKVLRCTDLQGKAWLCSMKLTLPDGETGQTFQIFSNEQISKL